MKKFIILEKENGQYEDWVPYRFYPVEDISKEEIYQKAKLNNKNTEEFFKSLHKKEKEIKSALGPEPERPEYRGITTSKCNHAPSCKDPRKCPTFVEYKNSHKEHEKKVRKWEVEFQFWHQRFRDLSNQFRESLEKPENLPYPVPDGDQVVILEFPDEFWEYLFGNT